MIQYDTIAGLAWARERCCFLTECRMRRLNQASYCYAVFCVVCFFWVVFSSCLFLICLLSYSFHSACTNVNGTVWPYFADVPLRYSFTQSVTHLTVRSVYNMLILVYTRCVHGDITRTHLGRSIRSNSRGI